jgi:hypothetical protein
MGYKLSTFLTDLIEKNSGERNDWETSNFWPGSGMAQEWIVSTHWELCIHSEQSLGRKRRGQKRSDYRVDDRCFSTAPSVVQRGGSSAG